MPRYIPAPLSSGRVTSVGSDSMSSLVDAWVENYKEYQRSANLQVVSYGSASAPAALIEGTANLGHMARPMKEAEVQDFKTRYGFEPTQIRTAAVATIIYVSKRNPLSAISFNQLDGIFSASRKRGAAKQYRSWGDLGVHGEFGARSIMPLGLVDTALPYTYFKQQVLLQSDYANDILPTAKTASAVDTVAVNNNAIAYGGVATALPNSVKQLAVRRDEGETPVSPATTAILSGSYPLSRYLNLYFVRFPGKPMDPNLKDFLKFVLSAQGQKTVKEQGLIPLSPELVKEELSKLDE